MSQAKRAPTPEEVVLHEEHEASLRELQWLVDELQESLISLKEGLEECVALLQPTQPASTLVLSTVRSEGLKGFITRVGTQLVKGDIQLRMFGLPNSKGLNYYKLQIAISEDNERHLVLDQLIDCGNFVQEALDGLPRGTKNARVLNDEMTMLMANIKAAKNSLRATSASHLFPYHALDPNLFDPPLPSTLSLDISINEAAIVAEIRTLDIVNAHSNSLQIAPDFSSFGLTNKLASAFGAKRPRNADGVDDNIYKHRGNEVKVRERVRVESQDPSLMSVMAKLGSLEHSLELARRNLATAMEAAGVY